MAVITPNTDVILLKVPLEIDDINQLTFANKTAQYNYFSSLPKYEANGFTYQRKDGTISFPLGFDEAINFNYVMYRNNEFSDKWFYAFIANATYVSNDVTKFDIKTDTFQTWQFDLEYKPCLIDREHTNDDTIGSNTLPEGLELGEMVCNGSTVNFGGGLNTGEVFYTVIEVSQVENKGESSTLGYQWVSGSHDLTPAINSLERGTIPLIIGGNFAGHSSGQVRTPDQVVHLYDEAGLSDSIVNIYMLPQTLIGGFNEIEITATPSVGIATTLDGIGVPTGSNGVFNLGTSTFTRPSSINNYQPKNAKLYTYPYCYFNISNNAGSSLPYHYEDFGTNVSFKVEGTFGASGSTKATPIDYKFIGNGNALDYSVSGAKYPICSWTSDSYTNWLTQNAVNMETQWRSAIVGGLISTGAESFQSGMAAKTVPNVGFKKGAIAGGISGGAEAAGNLISVARQQHLAKTQANLVSDQTRGNLNAGDFVWAKYRSAFTFLPMSIKREYAERIDQYFSQFGYKCNLVKLPNITGRRNWNYVKTVGCYIKADIPQDDLAEIKAMFDRGITLWHNPATFADYSQNNDII